MDNCCYVYKWTHTPSLMWYVGSRTAKNSHPNDGYVCSSIYVKPLILNNSDNWHREIIAIGSAQEMRELEQEILQTFDAAQDARSFNRSNSGKPINHGIPWNKGLRGAQEGHRLGKKHTPETLLKMSAVHKGKTSWNKGMSGEQHHNFGKKYNIKKTKKHSEEFKQALRDRLLINNAMKLKLLCPHCDYQGPKSRWHWDKCRFKV